VNLCGAADVSDVHTDSSFKFEASMINECNDGASRERGQGLLSKTTSLFFGYHAGDCKDYVVKYDALS
jgi:hypothetical protein